MGSELILASQSPGRIEQLRHLGFQFQALAHKIDERKEEEGFSGKVSELPLYLAKQKALSIAKDRPDATVIGSDQLLIFEGEAHHKPQTLEEIVERLLQFQGKTHELHTALFVARGTEHRSSVTVARMTMRELNRSEIEKYVQLDQALGCAGGYKIEDNGMHLFSKIETPDHSAIVGLPLLSLVAILREFGFSRL